MSEAVTNAELAKRVGFNAVPDGGNATAGKVPVFTGIGLTIAEQIQGLLNNAPATGAYSGVSAPGTLGESAVFGSVMYLKSDGKYWKALGTNAGTTYPAVVICLGTGVANDTVNFLHLGYIRLDAWNWSIGNIYLSTATAGLFTDVKSTTVDTIVQVLGYAKSSNIIFFNPNPAWIEVAE